MRKLKIGLVFDDSLDKPDGVQQFVLTLGGWLIGQGHEVHYLVGQTKRSDLPNVHSLSRNINVRFNKNRMAMPLPARKKDLQKILDREQFDVLHVQVPYSPVLAGRIIRAAGPNTAVIGTFHIAPHSRLVTIGSSMLGLWVHKSLRRFDFMSATSAPAQAFAKRTFHIKSQVVPLPLKLEDFYNPKCFDRYAKSLNVVFLGRLVERKGCQYLLHAAGLLKQKGLWPENTRLIICGTGPLEARLKETVADLGLGDVTEFAGFVSEADKPRYLAAADVAIYPSTGGESFGIVLLEAMAAARGVILAGNNPGYASVLAAHPESLFDPFDTKKLADKLLSSLKSPEFRKQAHAWQQEYVRQFDISEVGNTFMDIYNQALRER